MVVEANTPYTEDPLEVVDRLFGSLLLDKEPPLEGEIGDVIKPFFKLERYEGRTLSKWKFSIRTISGF